MQPPANQYTTESILSDIKKFKENKSYFSNFGDSGNRAMEHLDGNRQIDFYKNNLCVFVDFDYYITFDANRMYLGELTSNQDDLTNFGKTVESLSFDCYLLHGDGVKEFKSIMKHNNHRSKGVLIGFLPSSSKDAVLSTV